MRLLLLLSLFGIIKVFCASTSEGKAEKKILIKYDSNNASVKIDVSIEATDDSDIGDDEVEIVEDKEGEEQVSVQLSHGEDAWIFPHKIGIRNHANNCYASALISCLYNIPIVQKALFDQVSGSSLRKEESIAVALATIFYKMRFGRSFIDLEQFFIPAVKKEFTWEFGGIECVLEFWNQLSSALPEFLFQFELQENRFRKSDNVLIKSFAQKSNLILVAPSKKYRNIEEFLEKDFVDEEAEDFIIESDDIKDYPHLFIESGIPIPIPEQQERLRIPSKTTLTILNCPEVLIFGVKRVRWNSETNSPEFDSTHLGFPEKLIVNSEEYTIVGNVEYDEGRIHYYSQNYDLLNDQWYIHDDKQVTRIPDTEEDFTELTRRFIHNSSMVFYVKSSSLELFKNKENVALSDELVMKLKTRSSAATSNNNLNLKRSRKRRADKVDNANLDCADDEPTIKDTKLVKKGRGSLKKRPKAAEPQETAEISDSDIGNKKPRIRKDLKSDLDLSEAKVCSSLSFDQGPDFRLGSKQFLFSKDDGNDILEPILMAIAFHPRLVTKLFEIVARNESPTPTDFVFKFALVVLRILTGHMDISTRELFTILVENYSVEFSDIGTVWRKISQLISSEISSIPDLKVVKFKEDEPISIETFPRCDSYSLKPHKTIKITSGLVLSGPAYDSILDSGEGGEGRTFNRNILKCNDEEEGIILPVPVERIFKDSATEKYIYDASPVQINTGSYLIYGCIGIDRNGNRTFAIYTDHLNQSRYLFYASGILMYKEKSVPLQQMIIDLMKTQSSLFLLTKSDGFYEEMPMLSHVPKILINELC